MLQFINNLHANEVHVHMCRIVHKGVQALKRMHLAAPISKASLALMKALTIFTIAWFVQEFSMIPSKL